METCFIDPPQQASLLVGCGPVNNGKMILLLDKQSPGYGVLTGKFIPITNFTEDIQHHLGDLLTHNALVSLCNNVASFKENSFLNVHQQLVGACGYDAEIAETFNRVLFHPKQWRAVTTAEDCKSLPKVANRDDIISKISKHIPVFADILDENWPP